MRCDLPFDLAAIAAFDIAATHWKTLVNGRGVACSEVTVCRVSLQVVVPRQKSSPCGLRQGLDCVPLSRHSPSDRRLRPESAEHSRAPLPEPACGGGGAAGGGGAGAHRAWGSGRGVGLVVMELSHQRENSHRKIPACGNPSPVPPEAPEHTECGYN